MLKLQLLLYSFLIPSEFNVLIGSLSVSPYRLMLLILFPFVVWGLIENRSFKFHPADGLALSICIWPSIALIFNTGGVAAIESGGILFAESFTPYFLSRMVVTNYQRLKEISITILKVILILVLCGLLDSLSGQYIVHNLASSLTGNSFAIPAHTRFNILRAVGPTDHAIIYGSICAAGFAISIAFFLRKSKYIVAVGVVMVGVVTSLSSAPLLSIFAQVSLMVWSKIFRGNKHKWVLFLLTILFLYIVIDILSNRDPFRVMFSYLLFNAHNGYVRYNMWINSIFLANQSIDSFIFGYGFSKEMFSQLNSFFWENLMSRSVDSYWMVILLRYGWVMVALNVLFIFTIFSNNVKQGRRIKSIRHRRLNEAFLISAISFSLLACTVHLWGSSISIYMILLGSLMTRPPRQRKSSDKKKEISNKTRSAQEIREQILAKKK